MFDKFSLGFQNISKISPELMASIVVIPPYRVVRKPLRSPGGRRGRRSCFQSAWDAQRPWQLGSWAFAAGVWGTVTLYIAVFFEPTLVHSEVNSNGWLIARAFVMVFSKGCSWWSQGANGRLPIQLPIPEDDLLDCVCEKAGAVEAW